MATVISVIIIGIIGIYGVKSSLKLIAWSLKRLIEIGSKD